MFEWKDENIPTITVLGSSHIDLVTKAEKIPDIGETVWGGEFEVKPGGKGANQAVAASRLGANVKLIGKVGNDYFGKKLVNNIESEGIDTTHLIQEANLPTGTASIIVDSEGNNLIAVAPGADANLSINDLKKTKDALEQSDAFLAQLEVPIQVIEKEIEKASEMNVITILNPAPAQELSENLLRKIDILVPNRLELMDIADMDRDSKSIEHAAQIILEKGPKAIVATLGKKGAVIIKENEKEKIQGIKIEAVDTTGAGDAFCGALATAIGSGKPLSKAVKLGNIAGALATTKLGAQEALPTSSELEEFAKKINY